MANENLLEPLRLNIEEKNEDREKPTKYKPSFMISNILDDKPYSTSPSSQISNEDSNGKKNFD